MSNWKNAIANNNLIQQETGSAMLIKLPGSDYVFWHPSKLVRQSGKNGYRLSIGFTDDFKFKIFKNGKGKYNKYEKIDEKEINAEEFAEYFNEIL